MPYWAVFRKVSLTTMLWDTWWTNSKVTGSKKSRKCKFVALQLTNYFFLVISGILPQVKDTILLETNRPLLPSLSASKSTRELTSSKSSVATLILQFWSWLLIRKLRTSSASNNWISNAMVEVYGEPGSTEISDLLAKLSSKKKTPINSSAVSGTQKEHWSTSHLCASIWIDNQSSIQIKNSTWNLSWQHLQSISLWEQTSSHWKMTSTMFRLSISMGS